jgi:hypothetical protein
MKTHEAEILTATQACRAAFTEITAVAEAIPAAHSRSTIICLSKHEQFINGFFASPAGGFARW